MMTLEMEVVREENHPSDGAVEGFCLGSVYVNGVFYGFTLEDEDRRLEEGNEKVYGRSAMPLGRFRLELYNSPKHGLVPRFMDVPGFDFTEFHGANHANQLLGCIAVGRKRTEDGVADCRPVVDALVAAMQDARAEHVGVYCTITRKD